MGVAVDCGQRCAEFVGGVGDELADLLLAAVPGVQRVLHVTQQGVERDRDLADLGPFVGELVRHPRGHPDLAGVESEAGHLTGGLRDPAQWPQLTPYDEHRDAARGQYADPAEEHLPADQAVDGVVDVLRRQPGDHRDRADLRRVCSVLTQPRQVDGVVRVAGGQVVERGDGLVREGREYAVRGDDVAGGT